MALRQEQNEAALAGELPAIGRRLRAFRRMRRLRLKDLAASARCSESLLSRIENDLVTPSLSTLHRLCRSLGVSVAALLDSGAEEPCIVVQPAADTDDGRSEAVEGDGSRAASLVPHAEGRLLEGFVVTLLGGGPSNGPFRHEGEEVGFVLEGELELVVEGRTYRVTAGSSFFFRSDLEHSYRAIGAARCRVVWINTPPTF